MRFLYCLANFSRAARCLAVSRGFFCLLRGLQPSLFINLQIVFFPPTWPLLANSVLWKLSGRVFPFVLNFVQNSFSCLIKDFRSSGSFLVFKPVISWQPFHYPTFRFFQLFGNFFNWQPSRSKYRCLGSQVAELFSINRVHLSWYSQNRGKIVSNSGHKIRQIFGGKK